ncbi:hypothetical protein N2152v2_003405 [Parachlorella kessleri]
MHASSRSPLAVPLPVPQTPELPEDQASVASSGSAASLRSLSVAVAPVSTAAAVHEVPSLLSQLVSGHLEQQILAARKLFSYCRDCGEAVHRAVVEAKGVHVLLIMLDSLDSTVRDLCTRTVTQLAADERVRLEIAAAPGGVSRVVQSVYKGVLEGQASAGSFLEVLAASPQGSVKAACCHAKVVPLLTKALGTLRDQKATAAALGALQAFCRDPDNVKKMVWADGVPALLDVLREGGPELCQPTLALLVAAARQSPDSMQAACEPRPVEMLSGYIGSSEADLQAQALAAEVLAAVATLPRKKGTALAALADHTLPRACEVVRSLQADPDSQAAAALRPHSPFRLPQQLPEEEEQQGERALLGACAAIVAHLAQGSPDCGRVVIYHTASLKVTVAALVATRQCRLAQALLQASLRLATTPVSRTPSPLKGGSASRAVTPEPGAVAVGSGQ